MNDPREVDMAFLIADLSGYTALTEAHGDLEAAKVVTRYVEIARKVLEPGARLVERVGDELLIAADDVGGAILAATRLRDATEREPLFPTIRAGLHVGRVLEYEGKYLGGALNLTARVAAYARSGQILCTQRIAALAAQLADVEFRELGPVHFKNVVDPVVIFEILSGSSGADVVVDPVCRMQVARATAPARLPYGDRSHHFCSFECARAFAERPEYYATSS